MDVSATSTRMSKLTTSMDNKPLLGVDHLEAVSKNREVSIAIKEEKEEEENGESGHKDEEKGNDLMEGDTGKKKKKEGEEEVKREEVDVNETNEPASSDTSGLLTTHL